MAGSPSKPSKPARPAQPASAAPPGGGGCLLRLLAGLVGLVLLGGVAATGVWYYVEATLPDVFSIQAYRQIAKESSRVYASGGEVVARFGDEIRTVIPTERIPPAMRFAMVCAEDAAFFSHPGLDAAGIARALWVDLTKGRYAQGASTLTQQLAKTRFLSREKTFTRKLKELVLARKLETKLSKDEILTLYLNEVYFGHGRYGVEEAARFFFGRSTSELDVAQAALLAGLVNSPGRLSPLKHPDRALARRSYVLQQMHKHGYIQQADLDRANAAPLPRKVAEESVDVGAWYVEAVRRQVLDKVDKDQLYGGGLRIEIAMDLGLQRAAEQAVSAGLQRIDHSYRVSQPAQHLGSDAAIQAEVQRLARDQGDKPPAGKVLSGVVLGRDEGRKAWQIDLGETKGWLALADARRYHPPPEPKTSKGKEKPSPPSDKPLQLVRGDVVRVSIREQGTDGAVLSPELGPQAALVALEPQTRLVRALVGGDDFDLHPFDRTRALRQPGSTFKTLAYGAAIEAGLVSADSEFKDEARSFRIAGRTWTPRNFSGQYDGKTYSLRDALALSINSIAVAVASQVGAEKIAAFAGRVGIRSPLTAGLPLALGASSVTPLELTNAYATLASGGHLSEPVLVTRIVDRDGKDLYRAPREAGPVVVAEAVTRQLTDMLGEVVRKGSGKDAQKAGRPVAGKTGTSNASRDAWFVGFSADLCAGVWVGYDDRKEMPKGTGGGLAVPIWTEFMQKGLAAVPVTPLPRLPHVPAGPVANLPGPAGDLEAGATDLRDDEWTADPQTAQPPSDAPPQPRRPAAADDEALEPP